MIEEMYQELNAWQVAFPNFEYKRGAIRPRREPIIQPLDEPRTLCDHSRRAAIEGAPGIWCLDCQAPL